MFYKNTWPYQQVDGRHNTDTEETLNFNHSCLGISCINEDFKKKLLVAYIFLLVIAAKITGPSGKETEGSDQQNVRRSYYH